MGERSVIASCTSYRYSALLFLLPTYTGERSRLGADPVGLITEWGIDATEA